MKFIIIKNLANGRYFVKAELSSFTESDQARALKFGYPLIQAKAPSGKDIPIRINQLNQLDAYGFYNQNDADEYAEYLRLQIIELKKEWEKLNDNWSKQEEF